MSTISSIINTYINPNPQPPEKAIQTLASINGSMDVYSFYEGPQGFPKSSAGFMRERLFEPLFSQKPDAKLYLYSLKGWDFTKSTAAIQVSTPLGDAINRINITALECIYSSSFFQYCTQVSEKPDLYAFIQEELPKKQWLMDLSQGKKDSQLKVKLLFDNNPSLFDCMQEVDSSLAYSAMQYIEGYYLIQESVKKCLEKRQAKIEIAFLLPNDESKYYLDFPKEIPKMLELDFKEQLAGISINITFQFFQYGDSPQARPYIDKKSKEKIRPEEIGFYFNYLTKRC